jgi:mRNA interferase MazF
VVVSQGDVVWAEIPVPSGSEAGFRRPVVVLQGEAFNRSAIATVVCVPLTSNLRWADAPGNVALPRKSTGLAKDSVANVSQILSIDREFLGRRVGKISGSELQSIFAGIDIVLGR